MRLIDADALLNENRTDYPDVPFDALGEMVEWFTKIVDEQPTIPATRWVRCEDELPEKEGDYLVWTMLYGGHAYTDYYTPKYGWDEYKVIAWMPLPEPPKEVQE